jgi:heat shock protein HslJ
MLLRKSIPTLFLAGAILLAACSPQPPAEAPGGVPNLDGTSWILEGFVENGTQTPAAAGSEATLVFSDGSQAGGTAGCNAYGSRYQQQGSSISFDEIISTLMMCVDDEVMQQETRYLEALRTAGQFEQSGDQLVIFYGGGQSRLVFNRQ